MTLDRFRELLSKLSKPVVSHHKFATAPAKVEFFSKGKKGEQKVIYAPPRDFYFKGETFEATDSLGGEGTSIVHYLLGKRVQFPRYNFEPGESDEQRKMKTLSKTTRQLVAEMEGRHRFDTCDPALQLVVVVHFFEDCEFKMVVFGKRNTFIHEES
jgi:hypothetical protein